MAQLGVYHKNSPEDLAGKRFRGNFLIRDGKPSNHRYFRVPYDDKFVKLEYLILREVDPLRFEALFDYNGKRYNLRECFSKHLYDQEIPVSKKSKKTLKTSAQRLPKCTNSDTKL